MRAERVKEPASQPRVCSAARTLEVVGEKWALLVVREVFLGDRCFDEMARRTRAPRDTLAARLRTLMRWGDTYLAGEDGPPLVLEHTCGHTLAVLVVCEACGEPVRARDTVPA